MSSEDPQIGAYTKEIRNKIDAVDEEYMKIFYSSYVDRFISDNNRIWSTGRIFIPTSLAAFAVPVRAHDISTPALAVLAGASILLMFIWATIAEQHRGFQEKSLAWINAIQEKKGIHDSTTKLMQQKLPGWISVRALRWWLCFLVALGWAILLMTL
tara:strand:+ start:354 stop:821 length:468 start_codon:yes stop_codon:yes gene_type:complete